MKKGSAIANRRLIQAYYQIWWNISWIDNPTEAVVYERDPSSIAHVANRARHFFDDRLNIHSLIIIITFTNREREWEWEMKRQNRQGCGNGRSCALTTQNSPHLDHVHVLLSINLVRVSFNKVEYCKQKYIFSLFSWCTRSFWAL